MTDSKITNNTPTSDVVEVVRCKDCKYGRCEDNKVLCTYLALCTEGGMPIWRNSNDYCSYGRELAIQEALDRINRQKAEIERLNKEVDRLSQCVLYHEGQIVDAVKDFAERLKEEFWVNTDNNGDINSCLVPIIIDNLVKEMTESEK